MRFTQSPMTIALLTAALVAIAAPIHAADSGLVGTWQFVSETDRRADGTAIEVTRPDAYEGLLIYTGDGHMSVLIMPSGRTWSPARATLEEFRATVELGSAYAGRYEVDEKAQIVRHLLDVSLEPSAERSVLTRRFQLDGDRLVLSGTWQYQGETLGFEVVWHRIQ